MEAKKISFGFSKINKKPNLQAAPAKDKKDEIEIIDCLEGQSIKIVGKTNEEPAPLVIPLRSEDKTTIPARLAKLLELNDKLDKKEEPNGVVKDETLEQKAAREIMEDLKEKEEKENDVESFVVPLKPEDLPLDGAKEPSLNDYDNIPIAQFGLAMLRGMGWKDDPKKKQSVDNNNKLEVYDGPMMRPKGMGLGADKMAKQKTHLIAPSKNEVLEMKKGAFVKILAGKHKDTYGQIEGLDEDAGRVIVKFALGGNRESLNEFMVQLVCKQEYSKYSKVINSAKYEEFKNRQSNVKEEKAEKKPMMKQERRSSSSSPDRQHVKIENVSRSRDNRNDSKNDNERESRRPDKHASRRRSRDSDKQSESSDDESKNRPHHSSSSYSRKSSYSKKKSHKYKQRRDHSRNRHHSSDDDEKRHKKKTKRSKKQRSRSRSRR